MGQVLSRAPDKPGLRVRQAAYAAVFAAILIAAVLLLQSLLTPKYMSGTYEGAMLAEYYAEKLPHDIIFIGDCEVYANYSPIKMWEEYGITSYIRGGPQQLAWQSYYVLEDTLRRETPKAVVFNASSLQFPEPVSEGYNRLNLDGLPLTKTKLDAIDASKMEGESVVSYIVPMARYHSRWDDLGWDDVRYLFGKKKVAHNGYMLRADVKPLDVLPSKRPLPDYSFGEAGLSYLGKITALCRENGINLVLVKSPAVYPFWYDEWDRFVSGYAEENGALYLNLVALSDEMGIDLNTDTYDAGLHLNVYGAEKAALYLGGVLASRFGLAGHKDDQLYCAAWEEKTKAYNAMKVQQETEFNKFGKVLSYTY